MLPGSRCCQGHVLHLTCRMPIKLLTSSFDSAVWVYIVVFTVPSFR